jgi:hypothetical protein
MYAIEEISDSYFCGHARGMPQLKSAGPGPFAEAGCGIAREEEG